MFMFSIKTLSVIQEQLNRLHAEIREAARWPDLSFTPPSARDEALQLNTAAFGYLAGGDALPFFRPHFLEISGNLFNLTRRLAALLSFLSSLPPEERKGLAHLSDVFNSLISIADIFKRTWLYLNTDMRKAAEKLKDSAAMISKFEDIAVKQLPGLAALLGPLTDTLYLVDLSIKKMIILLRT